MHVKPALAAPRDGKVLENLGLQRCAESLGLPYPILFRRRLEFGERGDAKVLVEPQYLLRTETWHSQHLEHACGDFLPELLEARMTAGPVQLGDDIGDGVADSRNFGETTFGNQHIEREGEGRQAIRRARVGLGSVLIATTQRGPLCVFAKQRNDHWRVDRRHPLPFP